ncbi:MAG: FAD-dependent oxidoreductase, partial [Alphaproteobacteria bacterium]
RLDVKLSKGRVQTPSLTEVLARLLKLKSSSEFEALNFRYPKGGLGRIWDAIQTKASKHGEFHLRHTVTGVTCENGVIRAIQTREEATGQTHETPVRKDDFVASTLPMAQTVEMLSSALPADTAATVKETVTLNDLLLVFLHVDTPNLMKDSWVFVPDPDIIFHRLSEQESFDPGMTPGGSIVCCEIMSSDVRPMAAKSDDELIDTATADLHKMGYDGFKVRAAKVIRLPRSYPVYRTGYEAGLKRVTKALDGFKNFRSIGRQGSFNYIGTLDAMDIGYGFARWLPERHQASWEAERARTNHYPVLD